ncbi:hypothetical protein [Streptomyces decoyicus]|uniref:hypothetical protein n=1 Tax=Streptomyces decoyicus TaxID=249567 RepID=UPI0033A63121
MRRPLSASGPNNPYRTGSSAGYRNDPKAKPAVLLDMTNDRTAYAVSAQTAGDSAQHMVLRVNLPCHLPPGAEQQQF